MQNKRISKRKPSNSDHGAAWISYSDMMAALLLIFVMVLVFSIYQYFIMLDTKTKEINEKEILLSLQQSTLDDQSNTLALQKSKLDEQSLAIVQKESELESAQSLLLTQQNELDAKTLALNSKTIELDKQSILLVAAQSDLSKRESELSQANEKLSQQQEQMASQQKKLDDLIGVKTAIIKELSNTLSEKNLKARVDSRTGDIVLESTVLFDTAKFEIKDTGKELLNKFLIAYYSVLMRDEYKDYLGEIIIEGHTDTAGDYFMNLKLSQDRALSVAKYCLEIPSLTASQRDYLRDVLTAKGKSFSSPIYNADGTVNMDSSRRVEFKFRLKDSEMIEEISKILNQN